MRTYYGFDLGIKAGAICRLSPGGSITFLPWPEKALWRKIPLQDAEAVIRLHHDQILLPWYDQSSPASVCFGDWSVREVLWGRTMRTSAVLKAYLAGLYTGVLRPSVQVTWISPQLLRKVLDLGPTEKKEVVWAAFFSRLQGGPDAGDFRNEHETDAFLLAAMAALTGGDFPWTISPMPDCSIFFVS